MFEVSAILKKKREKNKVFYLVSWKGYPSEDDSWEPAANIE